MLQNACGIAATVFIGLFAQAAMLLLVCLNESELQHADRKLLCMYLAVLFKSLFSF